MKPVVDKAEVSIDFPDKFYIGSFGRTSSFEVTAAEDEVLLKLVRPGDERREVTMHLHHYLLADILAEMAEALKATPPRDEAHREPLHDAATALAKALAKKRRRGAPAKSGRR